MSRKATKSEIAFFRTLVEARLPFKFQEIINVLGKHRIVDFYITYADIIIEIDGGYHTQDHVSEADRLKDCLANRYNQIRTLRFTNELAETNPSRCIAHIHRLGGDKLKLRFDDEIRLDTATKLIKHGKVKRAMKLFTGAVK